MESFTPVPYTQGGVEAAVENAKLSLECKICYENINNPETLIPCMHHFCKDCIINWKNKNPMCPLCRSEITSTKSAQGVEDLVQNQIVLIGHLQGAHERLHDISEGADLNLTDIPKAALLETLKETTKALKQSQDTVQRLAKINKQLIEHGGGQPIVIEPEPLQMRGAVGTVPKVLPANFSKEHCSPRLKLLTPSIIENVAGQNNVAAVFGTHPFPKDVIYTARFTVLKSEKGKGSNMMFGVTTLDNPTTEWIGGPRGSSWSINRNTGMKCHRGTGKDYAKGLKSTVNGETLEVIVDGVTGDISFSVGSRNFGIAYTERVAVHKGNLYPALSINDKTDKVSFDYFGPLGA